MCLAGAGSTSYPPVACNTDARSDGSGDSAARSSDQRSRKVAALLCRSSPNAANSSGRSPEPRPSTKRPPLIRSNVSADFATCSGCRNGSTMAAVPITMRSVAAASMPSHRNGSSSALAVASGPCGTINGTSRVHSAAKPRSSASRAMRRASCGSARPCAATGVIRPRLRPCVGNKRAWAGLKSVMPPA
ncbi:hypothetical protein D3C81_1442540 [compost metagenome]